MLPDCPPDRTGTVRDYLASRLERHAERAFEAHCEVCDDCAAALATAEHESMVKTHLTIMLRGE